MSDYIKQQMAARKNVVDEARALLDSAAAEKRDLTGDEQQTYERMDAEIDRRSAVIASLEADEKRAVEINEAMAKQPEIREQRDERPRETFADVLRSMKDGEARNFLPGGTEFRDVLTSSTGAPVNQSFYGSVVELARKVGPMLDPTLVTLIETASGEPFKVPTQATYSTSNYGTEGTAKTESNPTFNALLSLGAYSDTFIMQVSEEMFEDSAVNLEGFLAKQAANALGTLANTWLTTGTGTTQANGVVSGAGSGVTGATAVTGAFSYANVVDLIYSLDGAVRAQKDTFAVMGGTSAMAALRKLTNPAGYYIWEPSMIAGQPATVLGYKLIENVGMTAPALSAKSLIAGDFSSYFVRIAGGIQLKRSDEFAFDAGLVTFRGRIRLDGVLTQASHVKYFIGNAA